MVGIVRCVRCLMLLVLLELLMDDGVIVVAGVDVVWLVLLYVVGIVGCWMMVLLNVG